MSNAGLVRSSTFAWRIPWVEEPDRLHGVAESRTQLSDFTFTLHFHALEKDMTTHSSVLAWRIPGTEEPGVLLSMGSHRLRHDWNDLAAVAPVSPKTRRAKLSQTEFWLLIIVNIAIAWQDSLQGPYPVPLLQETPFLNDPFISTMEVVYFFFEPGCTWALILCEAVFQKLMIQWWTKLSSSHTHGTYILLKGDGYVYLINR